MFIKAGEVKESQRNLDCRIKGLEGRILWFDADANFEALSTRACVQETIENCKKANINTIVLDVKPLSGFVTYASKIAPGLFEHKGAVRQRDYDYLQTVLEEAKAADISVHAAVNVFSEGRNDLAGSTALLHPDWQCVEYGPEGIVRLDQLKNVHNALFVNPLNPEVKNYELSIVSELCRNYDIDGIVLDRIHL